MLNESPAGADERDGDEQQCPLQTGKESISDANGLSRPSLPVPPHSSFATACVSRKREAANFGKRLLSSLCTPLPEQPIPPTEAAPSREQASGPGLSSAQPPACHTPLARQEPREAATGGQGSCSHGLPNFSCASSHATRVRGSLCVLTGE